jgi:hypothetical protein
VHALSATTPRADGRPIRAYARLDARLLLDDIDPKRAAHDG